MVKTKQEYPLVLTITNPAADDVSPSDCAQTPWIRCHFLVSVSLGCNHKTHGDKIDGLEHFFMLCACRERLPIAVFKLVRIIGKCSMHGKTKYSQWNASKSNYGIEVHWSQSMDWVPLSSAIERITYNVALCELDCRTNRNQSNSFRSIGFSRNVDKNPITKEKQSL